MVTIPVVEGQTAPIEATLLFDSAPVLIQGQTGELVLTKADGTVVDTAGDVQVLDDGTPALKGKVQYNPDAADLKAIDSPLQLRWKMTAGGLIAFYPSGEPDILEVHRP